jgi:peptidoglycan/xylan/chitin deacetylase (PgdA/CDA1 family)
MKTLIASLLVLMMTNHAFAKDDKYWPNGAQLVVSISMQFEAGGQPADAESPFPKLALKKNEKDLPAETWFNYGYKEGIPRLLNLWDKHQIKVTSHMVGLAALKNPELAKEIVSRGHEGSSHGMTWASLRGLSYAQEKKTLHESVEAIAKVTGVRPLGFNAFWLRGTPNTLNILQEEGFLYHIDDLSRDEPFIKMINGQKFVVVPYTIRNNDIALIEGKHFSPDQFLTQLKLEFDHLYVEGKSNRRMMSISLHDRMGGTPAMVEVMDQFLQYAKQKEGVVFMRKDDIAKLIKDDPKTLIEK